MVVVRGVRSIDKSGKSWSSLRSGRTPAWTVVGSPGRWRRRNADLRLVRGLSEVHTTARLISSKRVLARHLRNPEFRREWERSTLARAVAVAVASYRAKHRLTQTELARKLGVRQPHIARLEAGEHTPSLEMLQRLSRALGLRFIVEVTPIRKHWPKSRLALPRGVKVVEDVVTDGSRILVATG